MGMSLAVMDTDGLVEELVDRWSGALKRRSWAERLQLLTDIHEKLREDVDSVKTYADLSPRFIARVVDRLNEGEVICEEQAHIYASSIRADHREAAGRFFNGSLRHALGRSG
jgi:hypothetical protein